jgi:hypothetical protein
VGYEVYATRAVHWVDAATAPIPLDEWLAYVESDPEMRLDGYAEAEVSGGAVLRYENEGLAVWLAWSGDEEDGNRAWFDFRKGCVVVKNPDEEILSKLVDIATALGARVVGDDGELYPQSPAAASADTSKASHRDRPWWRFW